jgi:MoaA/NifB/PqqE/SkfB family radical SAM enzyme
MGRYMELSSLLKLSYLGITTVLFKRENPLLGSIILTDKCNLSCRHCAVKNITAVIYPYAQIKAEMQKLYSDGIRILFFYGGEPFLWEDHGVTLRDLVIEAKMLGFLLVSVVTNGTLGLDLPEADLILVSLDGGQEKHNEIRGETYDLILENIKNAPSDNICLYMAINQINKSDIEEVCETARHAKNVWAVSFNFHTPYPGTEHLKLSREEKQDCCGRMAGLIDAGYPVLNLKSVFPYLVNNTFKTPCRQCVIMENGRQWVCGRCIDIKGLCQECGFFFAAEFSLLFGGNLNVIIDMLKTYKRYI